MTVTLMDMKRALDRADYPYSLETDEFSWGHDNNIHIKRFDVFLGVEIVKHINTGVRVPVKATA